MYLNSTAGDIPGGSTLYVADVLSPNDTTLVASLDAPYQGLKATNTPSGGIAWLTNALAYANGSAYNEELASSSPSTGRLYEDIFVRHWDTWLTPQRYALFAGTIEKGADGSYALSSAGVKNLLSGIPAPVTRPETPVQPFGDQDDYDISPDGSTVAFLSKAPELPKANYTASYIFLVPHDGSAVAQPINGPDSQANSDGHQGASAAPRFSPDGTKVGYLQQDGISYESDRNKLYVASVDSPEPTVVAEDWDRSPDLLRWSTTSSLVYVGAPDVGAERLFAIPTDAQADFVPTNLTSAASNVLQFYSLPSGDLIVQDSSIWSSTDYYILHPADATTTTLFEAFRSDPELAELGPQDVSEFYYDGSFGPQQAWIVYPTGFDSSKSYPLAFLVHGGPQSYFGNSWSTRWNYRVWSDQGYVVVAPNPTGSISYGKNLTDAIQNNWGSYPYEDLVSAWNYVNDNLDYVDTEHGIEAGASYGGYMTNWIQGHDLGRKFKALVTHDGITNNLNQYSTEELWFIEHDNNGTVYDDRANYERYDPLIHARNFSTPHFVVHSSLDYRLPESEGIYLFNVLQEIGVPSRFLSFPDENHWVLDRENSRVWHEEIFNWINHYSGVGGALNDHPIGQ